MKTTAEVTENLAELCDQALTSLALRHKGYWVDNFSMRTDVKKELLQKGFIDKNGHGRFRVTDDGRDHLEYLEETT